MRVDLRDSDMTEADMADPIASPPEPWSKAEIERLLAAEDFKYQNIPLPYSLSTGGQDRSATARAVFPDSLSGKSVLDLGCSFGNFCFEAAKRGATRVVGIDVDPENIRKARLLADCMGANIEFYQSNVETDSLVDDFDYVLCLNLLHHLSDPIALLDKLIARTKEYLILEIAGLGGHDRRKLRLSRLRLLALARLPVIYVGRAGTSPGSFGQRFFLQPVAMENLLRYQRNMFAAIHFQPSEHKGRYITMAAKRRIDDLVIVAGPTASGKSRLIDRIVAGHEPALCARCGIDDPALWPAMNAFDLVLPQTPHMERLLFHYDTLRPFKRSAHVHERDEALDILGCAQRVRVVTIWNPPEALLEQIEVADILRKTRRGVFRGNKRKAKIHALYKDPRNIVEHYREWFAFCRTRGLEPLVVLPHAAMQCVSVDEWERECLKDQ